MLVGAGRKDSKRAEGLVIWLAGMVLPGNGVLVYPAPLATVDAQNPWLGLVSFTEETRGYFHGREEEAAELGRRVQRKLLTVLFGQSGLGKTSILRAGLVPRLRAQGYCPVYVRIDYGKESPEPAEQIKQAIMRSARRGRGRTHRFAPA